jgi:HEAT repeat protein
VAAESKQTNRRAALDAAIELFQQGEITRTDLIRFADLSREESRRVATVWESVPETTRAELVRRFDELSENQVELNFGRILRVALEDSSAVVRQLATAALWEDESSDLLDRLRTMMADDDSIDVRAAAAAALERFAHQAAIGKLPPEKANQIRSDLLDAVNDQDTPYSVRRRALESLGTLGSDPEIERQISEAYDSGDHGLQCSALFAMGRSLDAAWLPIILAELDDDDAELRFEAARSAGFLGFPDSLPALIAAAQSEDAEVRHAAISAIAQIGGRGASRALERLAEEAGEADMELIDMAQDEVNTMLEPFQPSS